MKHIETLLENIERDIERIEFPQHPPGLYEPVSYTLGNGGKRMRPLMTLLACELFEGDPGQAINAALGMEIFHNFTLLHDDIMDDAPIRRNKPTVHVKWDANTAILSGDVMFAMAYDHIMKVPDASLRKVMQVFNQTVVEVCEGQQYDMDFESQVVVSLEDYLRMIRLKTAVLPAACLQTGAILAGADTSDQESVYKFGECVGLAFQLKDDWLDVYGEQEAFGKQCGGDIVANKKTWLTLKAFELANAEQTGILRKAFGQNGYEKLEKVRVVKEIYNQLTISEKAVQEMDKYHRLALEHLNRINRPASAKQTLRDLADTLLHRAR